MSRGISRAMSYQEGGDGIMTKNRQVAKFESRSNPGVIWRVTRTDKGELRCDCPGFTFRGRCKHIEKVEYKRTHDGRVQDVQV